MKVNFNPNPRYISKKKEKRFKFKTELKRNGSTKKDWTVMFIPNIIISHVKLMDTNDYHLTFYWLLWYVDFKLSF